MDWFHRLTGFAELDYAATRERLSVSGNRLHSRVNGRSYAIGCLELVSLRELRQRVAGLAAGAAGPTRVTEISGDVRALHQAPEHGGALFQVASQFNLLEMPHPTVTPERGVTGYADDLTQGPACAMAAGAATLYRNYFVPVDGFPGQTRDRQLNALAALGRELGHLDAPLWDYCNGYPLCSAEGLRRLAHRLDAADEPERDRLRSCLEIGLHWDVEVTDAPWSPGPLVSQALCSALPVAYSGHPARLWEPLGRLVLEAAYEATLLAGVVNSQRPGGSRQVLLTRLGGGAFGNPPAWIDAALERGLGRVGQAGLEVVLVSRRG